MPIFGGDDKFDKHKLQTSLKMAISRLNLQKNKKENHLQMQRREVADLLRAGKEESARIKVEGCIRESYLIESVEIINLFIDLLCQRLQLISESRVCPPDMKEAASTLIWASPRMENIPELLTVREQLSRKFGKEFVHAAQQNSEMAVNTKVYKKMSVMVPEPYFCIQYMKDIAGQFNVDWQPSSGILDASTAIQGIQQMLPDPQVNYHSPPPAIPQHPPYMGNGMQQRGQSFPSAPPPAIPPPMHNYVPQPYAPHPGLNLPAPPILPHDHTPFHGYPQSPQEHSAPHANYANLPPPLRHEEPEKPTPGGLPPATIDFSDLEAKFAALKKGKQ
jgi:vacuolar protein sorting-associated protein IST1